MPRVLDGWAKPRRLPGFTFAKTNHLPYDLAVKATLLVFKRHFGEEVEIVSDDEDLVAGWTRAIELAHRILGYPTTWTVVERLEDGLTHRQLVPA
jgi:hypothetical protein